MVDYVPDVSLFTFSFLVFGDDEKWAELAFI